jgi:hypothetical protein
LTISPPRARTDWKQAPEDLEAGNGEAKSRRRTWRPLVREVSTTAIVVDSVDAAVDAVASEEEATAEMANPDEDEGATGAVATRRGLSHSIDLATM